MAEATKAAWRLRSAGRIGRSRDQPRLAGRPGGRSRRARRARRRGRDPAQRRLARGRRGGRDRCVAESSSRPASSISTPTSGSPASRMPRRSPRDPRRPPMAGSRPSASWRTRRPRSTRQASSLGSARRPPDPDRPIEVLAYGAVSVGRAGETLAALGELADGGAIGFSDDGAPVRSAGDPAQRAGLRRDARSAGRRPSRGAGADRRRRGERRPGRDGPRSPGLAGCRRGSRGLARPGDPGRRPGRRAPRPTPPHPPVDRRGARSGAPGQDRRPAGDLRRHAAPPGAQRRVAGRRAALGLGGARRGRPGAAARGPTGRSSQRPYDPSLRVNPPLRSADDAAAVLAALVDGTADAIATDHAPHTRVDKEVEFGLAANGISGIETATRARPRGGRRRAAAARPGDRRSDHRPGGRPRGVGLDRLARPGRGRPGRPRRVRPLGGLAGRGRPRSRRAARTRRCSGGSSPDGSC